MVFEAHRYRPTTHFISDSQEVICIYFTNDSLPKDMELLKGRWVDLLSKTRKGRMEIVYTRKNKSQGYLQFGLLSPQQQKKVDEEFQQLFHRHNPCTHACPWA